LLVGILLVPGISKHANTLCGRPAGPEPVCAAA
jgi:hypothetical protein